MNKLFAFVGMCGAGKSTAADVLLNKGWAYIRFGQVTIDKIREEGKEITPENEKEARESLRQEHGMGAFALLSLPKIEEAVQHSPVVIDGLYSWAEYKILKGRFGDSLDVVAIHTSPNTRYERLSTRKHDVDDRDHRMRLLTPEQAQKRDYAEIENIEKGGPIAMATYTIINEGTIEELKAAVQTLM